MSNERLERIKERVNYHGHLDDDIEWLIEQVEHLKGLEESLRQNIKIKQEGIDFLKQENERYREALENALDEGSLSESATQVILKALESDIE